MNKDTKDNYSPKATITSLSKTIFCQNSGIVLGQLEVKIFEGSLAYLESHTDALYLHPFYRHSSIVLVKKLEDSLHTAQASGWILTDSEKTRLCLLTSAMMHNLAAIKQNGPSLPKFEYAAASAGRLLGLAKWYFYSTSQRITLPLYSISQKNENLEWQNFKHWVDSAYEVREEWTSKSRRYAREAQEISHALALKEIKSEVYRRVDTRKVWNWIHIQMIDHLSAGRLTTFENLFLNGDLEAHEWLSDDVDDMQEALLLYCDIGNDIMHFINKRLSGIRGLIKSFYSDFTLIYDPNKTQQHHDEEQTTEEKEFFSSFDKQAEALESLPPAPKRDSFQSNAHFYKAQAQWNILSKRYAAKIAKALAEADRISIDPDQLGTI